YSAQAKTNAPAQNTGATAKAAVVPASMSNAARPAPNVTQPEVATLDRSKMPAAANSAPAAAPVVRDAGDAPPSPQPAMRAPVKPISGGVLNGQALKLPSPVYPLHAKHARVTGTVVVEVVIDAAGKVISAKAVSGPAMLHASAEAAAKQARFSPTTLSGQPVKVSGVINYNFAFAQ
ncbi:MAG TPA: TonB family protein, partial [Pyrinomonadaceae bacterium]|nr:TonB family protein [Pyrinomonadaceae bacterium]